MVRDAVPRDIRSDCERITAATVFADYRDYLAARGPPRSMIRHCYWTASGTVRGLPRDLLARITATILRDAVPRDV